MTPIANGMWENPDIPSATAITAFQTFGFRHSLDTRHFSFHRTIGLASAKIDSPTEAQTLTVQLRRNTWFIWRKSVPGFRFTARAGVYLPRIGEGG